MRFYDISVDLMESPVYPGDPEPRLERVKEIGGESECNLSALYACLHNGTHMDAPLHFIEGGSPVEDVPLSAFIGPCHVVEVDGPVTARMVDRFLPWDCKRVLIKGTADTYIMESAGFALADAGVKLLGINRNSVGIPGNQRAPHLALLQSGVAILEGLNLSGVRAGAYFLSALPIKLSGCEAAPVRAVLIEE